MIVPEKILETFLQRDESVTVAEADLPDGYRVVVTPKKEHAPDETAGGVQYQRCGGGRRVIRKKIGGN